MFWPAQRVTVRPAAATQIHPKLKLRALRALRALLSVLSFTDSPNTVLALRTLYDQPSLTTPLKSGVTYRFEFMQLWRMYFV